MFLVNLCNFFLFLHCFFFYSCCCRKKPYSIFYERKDEDDYDPIDDACGGGEKVTGDTDRKNTQDATMLQTSSPRQSRWIRKKRKAAAMLDFERSDGGDVSARSNAERVLYGNENEATSIGDGGGEAPEYQFSFHAKMQLQL